MLVMMMMMTMVKLMVPLCTLSILLSSLCECALQHCSVRVLHLFVFSRSIKSRSIMLMRGKWEILLVDYFLVKTKIK